MTAAEFQPHFERALSQFASEQKGEVMAINVRSLLTFMERKGYPLLDNDNSMRNLANGFLSSFFGPTWDGVKYRRVRHENGNSSRGRSLLIGTDNVLDYLRYRGGD